LGAGNVRADEREAESRQQRAATEMAAGTHGLSSRRRLEHLSLRRHLDDDERFRVGHIAV
jgi:hypothetical protein